MQEEQERSAPVSLSVRRLLDQTNVTSVELSLRFLLAYQGFHVAIAFCNKRMKAARHSSFARVTDKWNSDVDAVHVSESLPKATGGENAEYSPQRFSC